MWTVSAGGIPQELCWYLGGLCTLTALLCARPRWKYWFALAAIVWCLAYRLDAPDRGQVVVGSQTHSARIHGVVDRVWSSSGGGCRYIVRGEIQLAGAPCSMGSALVYEWRSDSSLPPIVVGQVRTLFARARTPDTTLFPGEVRESDVCRAMGVGFVTESVSRSAFVADPSCSEQLRATIHQSIASHLQRFLQPEIAAVVQALLVGDRSGISPQAKATYAASGTIHMFSVSGAHVGIVFGLLLLVFGVRTSLWRLVLIVFAIAAFVWLTGAHPPAVRAALMAIAALVGRHIERQTLPLNLLCAAVFCMIAVDPTSAMQHGMLLSACAVASIVCLAPVWNASVLSMVGSCGAFTRSAITMMGTSVAASIGTAIPIISMSGQFPYAAPIANLIVIPVLGLCLPLAILLLALAPIGAAAPVAWCVSQLVTVANAAATFFSWQPETCSMADGWFLWTPAILCCVVMLWPLISQRLVGGICRLGIGIAAVVGILAAIPPIQPLNTVIYRRYGVVLATTRSDTLNVLFVGRGPAIVDKRCVSWVCRWHGTIRAAGIGAWGKRMSGNVVAKSVVLKSRKRTQKAFRP